MSAEEFPYDPAHGEPYNSREHYFVSRIGDVAGWLHAGRPRREAARIALRLHLRRQLTALVAEAAAFGREATARAAEHAETAMPDQTYLQQAQPSTFGHYLLSFVYSAVRDAWPGSTPAPAAPAASTAPACWPTAPSSPPPWASAGSSSTPGTRCGRSTG
jgi:argininosuccinate lyase